MDAIEDPSLDQFIMAFRLGAQALESVAPCIRGVTATA
jgi:hypothetical protein